MSISSRLAASELQSLQDKARGIGVLHGCRQSPGGSFRVFCLSWHMTFPGSSHQSGAHNAHICCWINLPLLRNFCAASLMVRFLVGDMKRLVGLVAISCIFRFQSKLVSTEVFSLDHLKQQSRKLPKPSNGSKGSPNS